MLQLLPHTVDDDCHIFCSGFDEKDRELITTVASDEICTAGRFDEGIGDCAENIVARGVSEPVVDLLQMNYIERQQKHAGTASPRTRGQSTVQLVKRPTSREARERIRGMSGQQAVGIVQ